MGAATVGAATEGQTGADAISTTRMRLRRVGAGDIQTSLATGQVISVPINVNLDVWAEIVRLESDRARLLVDWGNGNVDHTGCGSCRLENVYKKEGRYMLTAKVIDLNAAGGEVVVTQATVTINVLPAPIACAPVGTAFDGFAPFTLSPLTTSGARYTASNAFTNDFGTTFAPFVTGNAFEDGLAETLTVEFDSDKTSFEAGLVMPVFQSASYQAFSSEGAVVAAGNVTFAPIPATGGIGAMVQISSLVPLRKVVFDFPLGSTFIIDNVSASCK